MWFPKHFHNNDPLWRNSRYATAIKYFLLDIPTLMLMK